jgi:hypothetical protein
MKGIFQDRQQPAPAVEPPKQHVQLVAVQETFPVPPAFLQYVDMPLQSPARVGLQVQDPSPGNLSVQLYEVVAPPLAMRSCCTVDTFSSFGSTCPAHAIRRLAAASAIRSVFIGRLPSRRTRGACSGAGAGPSPLDPVKLVRGRASPRLARNIDFVVFIMGSLPFGSVS